MEKTADRGKNAADDTYSPPYERGITYHKTIQNDSRATSTASRIEPYHLVPTPNTGGQRRAKTKDRTLVPPERAHDSWETGRGTQQQRSR